MLTVQKRPEGQYFKSSGTERRTALKSFSKPPETVLPRVAQEKALADQGTSLRYKDWVRLHFAVIESSERDFTLVKGLIEFHRPKDFRFTYDRKQRSISVDVGQDQIDRLATFLSGIEAWVRKEKQFRHALKIALEFERRYDLERESVYAILKNSTVPNRTV